MKVSARLDYLIIILLGAAAFVPFLGQAHLFDWDEINFAECAREMVATGNYSRLFIDYQPFWEKPPLFIWLQAACMQVFGVGEFAARLPNAIVGILTLLSVYYIGRRVYDCRFAWWWVLAYFGSMLPHLYSKSGIIDPLFNLLIFWSLFGLVWFSWRKHGFFPGRNKQRLWLALLGGGAAIGLAVLTKGPVAALLLGGTAAVYWAIGRFRWFISGFEMVIFAIAAAISAGAWFGWDMLHNGIWFTREFITYQIRLLTTHDAGHAGFWGYHPLVLLLGCFPASVFALGPLFRRKSEELPHQVDFTRWMKVLFWVVLVIFTLVQSKIIHYSSMCYLPLTYLAALGLYRLQKSGSALSLLSRTLMSIIGAAIGGAAMLLVWLGNHPEKLLPYMSKDKFGAANLEAQIAWPTWLVVIGAVLLVATMAWTWRHRVDTFRSNVMLFVATAVFTQLAMVFIVPNIEGYSQRAAIEFYEGLQGRDCYVQTYGFKSYAHLFYSRKAPTTDHRDSNRAWLVETDTPHKPAYLVAKVTNAHELRKLPNWKELYAKNGFVFFEKVQR